MPTESPAKSADVNQYSAPKLFMMGTLDVPHPRNDQVEPRSNLSFGLLSSRIICLRTVRREVCLEERGSVWIMIAEVRVQIPSGCVDARWMGCSTLEVTNRRARGIRMQRGLGESTADRLKSGNRLPCAEELVRTAWICKRERVTGVTGRKVDRTEEKKQKERADV